MLNARISHVALGTANPEEARRFYEDHVGLSVVQRTDDGPIRMGLGAGAHILEIVKGSGLDHFALELADDADFEKAAAHLVDHGVETAWLEASDDHPGALALTDPDGHNIQLHSRTDRSGEARGGNGRRPVAMHHVTLSTEDVPALVDFYVSLLQFRISDRMEDRFAWLRCNREHHTVAIVEGPAGGLDHYCYEVTDWNELKHWCDQLAAGDVRVTWGPGRHGPGNNLFIFFDDPDGVRIELSCEMERFWDDSVTYGPPRNWTSGRAVNLWGPAPEWRRRLDRAV